MNQQFNYYSSIFEDGEDMNEPALYQCNKCELRIRESESWVPENMFEQNLCSKCLFNLKGKVI